MPQKTGEITIRPEGKGDAAAVRAVNELAFGRPEKARIVDDLRRNCGELLSLVAEQAGKSSGISFSALSSSKGQMEG